MDTHFYGQNTLIDSESGQAMHSKLGPWAEAQSVYIGPSKLAERLAETRAEAPLVLHDAGLGIAANSLAAIECALQTPYGHLEVHSFETKPAGIKRALSLHLGDFDFIARNQEAVSTLLSKGYWNSPCGRITWKFHQGPYLGFLQFVPEPDMIFYDMYAPKSCPELWSLEVFSKIFERAQKKGALLITYAASSQVKVHLKLAGFTVGKGAATMAKSQTTHASPDPAKIISPILDGEWRHKIKSSHLLSDALKKRLIQTLAAIGLCAGTLVAPAANADEPIEVSTSPLGLINKRFNAAIDWSLSKDFSFGFKATVYPDSSLFTGGFEANKDHAEGYEVGARITYALLNGIHESQTGAPAELRLRAGVYAARETRTLTTSDRIYHNKTYSPAFEPTLLAHMPMGDTFFSQIGMGAYFWRTLEDTLDRKTGALVSGGVKDTTHEFRFEFNLGVRI